MLVMFSRSCSPHVNQRPRVRRSSSTPVSISDDQTAPKGTTCRPNRFLTRTLRPRQSCVIHVAETTSGTSCRGIPNRRDPPRGPQLDRPNELLLNGNGILWSLTIDQGELTPVRLDGLPDLNNDHVVGADADTVFVSANDWHIYRASLSCGATTRLTRPMTRSGRCDTSSTASAPAAPNSPSWEWNQTQTARGGTPTSSRSRWTAGQITPLTAGHQPADGPEYSPDGAWIYFNTEQFSTVAGPRPDRPDAIRRQDITQLTFDDRVNWFPHLDATGTLVAFLSYPPTTIGHPQTAR